MTIDQTTAIEQPSGGRPAFWKRTQEVTWDLVRVPGLLVNAYLFGSPGADSGEWVLIDTGLASTEDAIVRAAAERFGPESRPAAIVLTHGHFDHVGSAKALAERWDVEVFAHPEEMPYLTGRQSYPPPDPTVGGGLMSWFSPMYPRGPVDLGDRIQPLPDDHTIPGMPRWGWIHTPGHTPGHVSLYRQRDGLLIAGDAFVTVKQESAAAVLARRRQVHGPPAYYTTDWAQAWRSIRRLAQFEPDIAATGHGIPMSGEALRSQLGRLIERFDDEGIPNRGRYVRLPAIADEDGVHYVPPRPRRFSRGWLLGIGAAAIVGVAVARWLR